ncbi:ATPase, T2SS/T4P/T4SS family [Quadrisphaera sp. DSM 44207]|uniref:ATPase, T2SS/T4P/T4SS family n=1 Tax=Quadrisphaera sp. DSM 44207 TaxID=1881057 RepID=UPI000881415D|nr:ATPase, T2SS/T4P/T4SS family [Quadrisphaera sp. DSM 44207]SDQ71634.1 type IV pilus assembly protein PilB [Quadrisphaera sp. DSM 44207]
MPSQPAAPWGGSPPAAPLGALPAQAGPTSLQHLQRRRLGDLLVDAGVLSAEQLDRVLTAQQTAPGPRRRLGELVVQMGLTDERGIAVALADQLGLGVLDLHRTAPAPDVVRLLPQSVADRSRVLVVDRTPTGLVVAVADPTNVLALDDVKLHTGAQELTVLVAPESQIREHLVRAWSLGQDGGATAVLAAADDGEDGPGARGGGLAGDGADESDPVVQLVNRVLADAVRLGASDIHVETQREALRVRYRVDGLLRDVLTTSPRAAGTVVSRLKIISGLDIAERRVPQDGRARITVDGAPVDCRVSTLPALHGEKVVVRLLTRGDDVPPLKRLGFEPAQLAAFRRALALPQGLVLITGPTGSGKTATLYSALAEVLSPERNIVTLEDPVEVQLPGITQVQVNPRTGMTFQAGLRSVLRQDPDIVLVGEVRDAETAELALKASLTGHLVLTTLHTNSAVAALTRLVDMGTQPFLVASSLTASVAQRLVRRPCSACAEPYAPDESVLGVLGLSARDLLGATPRRGTGCPDCGGTGYRGRTAVYEVLEVDTAVRSVLLKDPSEAAVGATARTRGMTTLRASAVEKARRGETTFEEAVRVTAQDASAGAGHGSGRACPSCERPVTPGMLACPWCAVDLASGACRSCSRPLEEDWRVCPWCRTPA